MWELHQGETQVFRTFCFLAFDSPVISPGRHYDHGDYERRDYHATLDCYKKVFGRASPPMIWQSPSTEFKRDQGYRYYNLRDYVYGKLQR